MFPAPPKPQTDKVIEIIELLLDNLLQKRYAIHYVWLNCLRSSIQLQHIGLELNLQRRYNKRGHPQRISDSWVSR